MQSFIYPGKFLKATESLFSNERGQKFVFFHFQRVFLVNIRHQVTVTKIANEEVSKKARDHKK